MQQQKGSVLTLVLLGLLAAGVLATIGYGSYYQITRGTQDTMLRANTMALLNQAVHILASQATDGDADCVKEPPAGVGSVDDGVMISSSTGAPQADAWGSPIKYCRWNNKDPSTLSALQLTLISAGTNKTFDTSCADALVLTRPNGDDLWQKLTLAQQNHIINSTVSYANTVASRADLISTCEPIGTLRITLDTQVPYLWSGSAWLPLNAVAGLLAQENDACLSHPAGALARDAADNLLMCAQGNWTKVSP
jgi:hypothetical protein